MFSHRVPPGAAGFQSAECESPTSLRVGKNLLAPLSWYKITTITDNFESRVVSRSFVVITMTILLAKSFDHSVTPSEIS